MTFEVAPLVPHALAATASCLNLTDSAWWDRLRQRTVAGAVASLVGRRGKWAGAESWRKLEGLLRLR